MGIVFITSLHSLLKVKTTGNAIITVIIIYCLERKRTRERGGEGERNSNEPVD
jgi:hypothetical protein